MTKVSTSRTVLAAVAIVPCLVLLAPVAVMTLVLLAVAASARAIGRALEPSYVPWSDLLMFDATLGWKPRAGLDVHYQAEGDDVYHIETDQEGWPGRRTIDESDVVAIGDSFAFGYGIDMEGSFSALSTDVRIKAVGAPGYSMVQGVLLMEKFAERLHGKLVVWLVYLENDLQDNLAPEVHRYRAPFVRRGAHGWQIHDRHLSPAPWRCSDLEQRRLFARFCVPGPLADRAYAAADYLIARAHLACRDAGARLVVVTVPHVSQLTPRGERELATASGDPERCDPGLPDRMLAQSCRRHGILMVAGREYLGPGDYKRREGIHWSARGHRRVARLITRLADTVRHASGPGGVPAEAIEAVRAIAGEAGVLAGGPK
jgi:hypothetical protein